MKNINNINIIFLFLLAMICFSCAPKKRILKNNHLFKYVDNQSIRDDSNTKNKKDEFVVYQVEQGFKSEIEDKTTHLIVKNVDKLKEEHIIRRVEVFPPMDSKIALNGSVYTFEDSRPDLNCYQNDFWYRDTKIALQTLSIPIKFRKEVEDGSLIPNQVETGVNVGLAPVVKFNFNRFNPKKKLMGKSTNQFSINTGLLLNLGATDLKAASSAPDITIDRKAATFTYGTFLMFGVNNFNIGYAVGWDNALGNGGSNWVYQNKAWHGLVIALDIIKP